MTQAASMTFISTRRDGFCACGCGESVALRSEQTKYFSERCRQRAYRDRLKKRLREAGLPDRLNLQVADGTSARHGDAQAAARKRTRRSPDLRISYRKAVEKLTVELAAHGCVNPPSKSGLVAELWMRDLLTDRQRAALKEQPDA